MFVSCNPALFVLYSGFPHKTWNSWFYLNNTQYRDDTGSGSWTLMFSKHDQRNCDRSLRPAVDFFSKTHPMAKQTSHRKEPVWVWFLLFFISQMHCPPPPLRVGKHSALASCLNYFQARSASGMSNGTNMNSEEEKNSGWEMLSWKKYCFLHLIFWVHILSYLTSSLRSWEIYQMVSSFSENKKWLEVECDIGNLIFLFFQQGWLQHQGAPGICRAAWVCRPQPCPSTTVSRMINLCIYQKQQLLYTTCTLTPYMKLTTSHLPLQPVPVEFSFARWSPKDRPYDGGVCLAVLPVQPRRLPVNRSDTQQVTTL